MTTPIILNDPPNTFNAEIVHRDLEDNKIFWSDVTYQHQKFGIYGRADLEVNATHYYLVAAPGMENQLIQLAACWKPGKVEWVDLEEKKKISLFKARHSFRNPKVLKVTWVR